MAVETLATVRANVLLDDGTTASGGVKTVSTSLGTLNKDAWDVDKAWAIVDKLGNITAKSVYSVQKTAISNVSSY